MADRQREHVRPMPRCPRLRPARSTRVDLAGLRLYRPRPAATPTHSRSDLGTVGAVVATLVLAFFSNTRRAIRERRRRSRPHLDYDEALNLNPEGIDPGNGAPVPGIDVRLEVRNEPGREPAHGVEVLITEIETASLEQLLGTR